MAFFKKLFLLSTFLFVYIILNSLFIIPVRANGEFITDVAATYKVKADGQTQVTNTFTIQNVLSELYVTSYALSLENANLANTHAFQNGKEIPLAVKKDGEKTILTVSLPEAVVGKGNKQTFSVVFDDDSLATRTGEVWEISIPKLTDLSSFRSYNLVFSVPTSFGKEAYISPRPNSSEDGGGEMVYHFNKDNLGAGITAGFGQFQVFSFSLNYHLENPLAKKATIDIAIPPDTAIQKMYYQEIIPTPSSVHVDADGNWLATFLLSSRQRINIETKGFVQIFASGRPFPQPTQTTITDNLKPALYWETDDPQIRSLAQKLSSPRAIYDYVTQNLFYDYERVTPNVTRLGAKGALASPKSAICTEFTDLFIAIARAAGIPAREIEGYAYTENPKLQPLSLVADVLHSWPEYWDKEKKMWVPVDPTWGETTGGVDYFTKLDLRHFSFVVHGEDSVKPYPPGSYKLGTNPQKDVFVSFAQLPPIREGNVSLDYASDSTLPFLGRRIVVRVKNTGHSALYNLTPMVAYDTQIKTKEAIEVLPPYGTYDFEINLPFSFLGREWPDTILVSAGNAKISIPTYKNQVIVYNLIGLFTLFSFLILIILIRIKRLNLGKIIFNIWTGLRPKR